MLKFTVSVIIVWVFIFSNFFSQGVYKKAAIEVKFLIKDLHSHSKVLHLGMDKEATDSVDLEFGEGLYPPLVAPPPAFDAALRLNNVTRSLIDIRHSDEDFYTGTQVHNIEYQAGSYGDTIIIKWNMPDNIDGVIKDKITGTFYNKSLSAGEDSLVVTNSKSIKKLQIVLNYHNVHLPVELCCFKGYVVKNELVLEWETVTEINNYGFEIYKSTDKKHWEPIGTVQGYGTSNIRHYYKFVDRKISEGRIYYYKLKQIDTDGKSVFSEIISVAVNVSSQLILHQNYPNPFNAETIISFSLKNPSNVKILITNSLGEEVEILTDKFYSPGFHQLNFKDRGNLSSGIYYFSLITPNFIEVKKMLLLK